MPVSPDKNEAAALYVRVLAVANAPVCYLRLRGLDPDAVYHIDELDRDVGGDLLMQAGIPIAQTGGDFRSLFFTLHRV